MGEVVVRAVRPDEREAFLGPALRSWLDAYDGHLSQAEVDDAPAMLARAWYKRRDKFRVAVLDGIIVGFYSLGEAGETDDNNYLWHLYVDPQVQRRGVGHALNVAALAEIASRGATKAWLDVLRPNEKARAFYRALGWREAGASQDNHDLVIMECDIP